MKKLIILSAIIVLIFSCKKESITTTEETTTETTSGSDQETVQDSMSTDIVESTVGDENNESKNSFTFTEVVTDSSALPIIKSDNFCDNSSLKIKDLNSGGSFEYFEFNSSRSAELSAYGFKGSLGDKETVVIKDYIRKKRVSCNGEMQYVGIGLRCFIHIKTKNFKGSSNLPFLAASVQMDKAEANYKIVAIGFGIPGDQLEGLKTAGPLNVNGYAEIEKVYDRILSTLSNANDMEIDPEPIPY